MSEKTPQGLCRLEAFLTYVYLVTFPLSLIVQTTLSFNCRLNMNIFPMAVVK